VYRDGYRIKNTSNDGSTTDDVPRTGRTYTYKLCMPGSSTVCSNSVSVTF
jgi:hypothetical protein